MNNTTKEIYLTPASFDLLIKLVVDAPNWSGSPMLDITKEERGNLTQLKRVGLVTTSKDEGVEYAHFIEGTYKVFTTGKNYELIVARGGFDTDVSFIPSAL